MVNRPAFSLKAFMILYNVYQIIASVNCVRLFLSTGARFWSLECPDTHNVSKERIHDIANFLYWLKVTELSETVVFILRKKMTQVSVLHVFHHCSTIGLVYTSISADFGKKLLTIGLNLIFLSTDTGVHFGFFINSIIHVMMYGYYLITAIFGNSIATNMGFIKKSITSMQLIQFVIVILQLSMYKMIGCSFSNYLYAFYITTLSIFVFLFYDFYRKAYKA